MSRPRRRRPKTPRRPLHPPDARSSAPPSGDPEPALLPEHRQWPVLSRWTSVALALLLALLLPSVDGARGNSPELQAIPPLDTVRLIDSLRGRSGKLQATFVTENTTGPRAELFRSLFGEDAIRRSGVYPVDASADARPFAFLALRSFAEKRHGRVGRYRLGDWPGERGLVQSPAYENPEGFIEVTPDNQDFRVSRHFRLRDFLTHDQAAVWPKYLVLRARLLDKLELVIAELQRGGIRVRHMTVMSGFRTPEYNATGGDPTGRDQRSRHMYGDASDVFVDNDGDGWMDDLNGDGLIDAADAAVIAKAADRVEQRYPELAGGVGVYPAAGSHGPFTHIDARGERLRWGPE